MFLQLEDKEIVLFDYNKLSQELLEDQIATIQEDTKTLLSKVESIDLEKDIKNELFRRIKLGEDKEIHLTETNFDYWVIDSDLQYEIENLEEEYNGAITSRPIWRTWNNTTNADLVDYDNLAAAINDAKHSSRSGYENIILTRLGKELRLYLIHHDNYHTIILNRKDKDYFFETELKGEK
jgi:hypothetical protein